MTKKLVRMQRIEQEIKKEIALILHHKIKDPRIDEMMVVSDVKISRGLAYARVYVSFSQEKSETNVWKDIKVLQRASGYIRALLGRAICLRVVPELSFVYDNSWLHGIRISNLIKCVLQSDEKFRNKSNELSL